MKDRLYFISNEDSSAPDMGLLVDRDQLLEHLKEEHRMRVQELQPVGKPYLVNLRAEYSIEREPEDAQGGEA